MFLGRSKRTSRDRESGLVFQWRLPISNHLRFIGAFLLVCFITAGLAASVRVRVGGSIRQPERRGSLVLVPRGDDWKALQMLAMEAGPMPLRDDPSNDPAVKSLIDASMAAAASPGYRYQPSLRPVTVEIPNAASAEKGSPGLLPPLPEPEPPSRTPPLADPSRAIVLASDGLHVVMPEARAPAGMARGNRYLLAYAGNGQVTRVTTLFSAKLGNGGAEAESWLRQLKIEGGAKEGGWTAVEISSGS
jgi:hypothetical protein